MVNKLFKSMFAVAMVVGSALGFVACETEGDEPVGYPTVERCYLSCVFLATRQVGF